MSNFDAFLSDSYGKLNLFGVWSVRQIEDVIWKYHQYIFDQYFLKKNLKNVLNTGSQFAELNFTI